MAVTATQAMTGAHAQERRWFWWMMLAALLLLGAGIGLRDPWPSDEPRFTLVAKQMVASGDWLFPHRGSELYSDKPPMLMWLEASFYLLTASWRVAFLLPSLLAGLATLALTWDLGRRLWGPRVGLFAAVALLSCFQFVYQTKRAQIDPLIMALITLANWGLLLHLLRGPNWRAYWLGCFAAGLGVITKGVGVIALLMLLPYLLARWLDWPGVVVTRGSGWRWAGGAAAFFVAILLWLVPMVGVAYWRGTPQYLEYVNDILLHQTAKRYGGSVGGHAQPFWYFFPVLLFHFFPMSLAYVSAWRDWRRSLAQADARLLLLLGWCLLVFVFFSLAGGKREVYLMPMMPMLALALGPTLVRIVQAPWLRWVAFACTLALGVGLILAGAWALQGRWASMNTMVVERELAQGGYWLWMMMIAGGAVFLASAAVARPRRGLHGLLAGMAGWWLVWSLWGSVLLNDSNSAVGVMRRAGQIAGPGAEIGVVGWKEQNMLMADRPLRDFGFRKPTELQFAEATAWQAQAPAGRWIFGLREAVSDCVDKSRVTIAGYANRRQWWMFRADAVVAGCVPRFRESRDKADAQDDGG